MASLDRSLRKELESAVKKARQIAEAGARHAVEQLAVQHHEPWPSMSVSDRQLRNRLRAHGRQLGDARDEKKGTQGIDRLVGECAYEHWHRLLFARFLAENDLLIEPSSGMPLSLDECRELARERAVDWLVLASEFAEKMLPQIFRAGDPVLEVTLPPEKRHELEKLLEALLPEVFTADDSLGWVYQFWQSDRKDAVNSSEKKIGADELPAVTQLFTEDYMVLFLLHNTVGAWWAGKVLTAKPEAARTATTEEEMRRLCSAPGVNWEYLRFVRQHGAWRPAAGSLDGWPREAKRLTVLDPCMGSGHFLVFALPVLAALRAAEEGLSNKDAIDAVLRENLFGLEIDPRCTQIAAFNLALAAWKAAGFHALPRLHLACSGLSPRAKEAEWALLAGGDDRRGAGITRIHRLFQQGPVLGSLINPLQMSGDLLESGFHDLEPLFEKAIAAEDKDEAARELAVTAQGLAAAADILSKTFVLTATNVPYLGRGKQDDSLRSYCERAHDDAKTDLATCMVDRTLRFRAVGGTIAVVTPQTWLFLSAYSAFRARLLRQEEWNCVARLGPGAFETISGEVVNVALFIATRNAPRDWGFAGIDVSSEASVAAKASALQRTPVLQKRQDDQLRNPDAAVIVGNDRVGRPLREDAKCWQGIVTADDNKFVLRFWELREKGSAWEWLQMPPQETAPFTGREAIIRWDGARGDLHLRSSAHNYPSPQMLGRPGIAMQRMKALNATLFTGEIFGDHVAPVVPDDSSLVPALWCFCSSDEYRDAVREYDSTLKASVGAFLKVAFDRERWDREASTRFPNGLPAPASPDPTQWLFNGHPKAATVPLHVAVARLAGYRWPRHPSTKNGPDGLERHADDDGIVPLSAVKGESPAADRLARLLADAYGAEWSAAELARLLSESGAAGRSLDDWLRDAYFAGHCALFHERPFVWHLWDGRRDGFHALLDYHRLGGPGGEGRRTLEKLVYSYLGDWIDRQRADQKSGIEGADARVASAEHLKQELEKILEGEPPYDIFVRWKALHEQPLGWEPDLNDGVRVNIRPFVVAKTLHGRGKASSILRITPKIKWEKDRGKEPERPKVDYPWFWGWDGATEDFAGGPKFDEVRWNDLHYTRAAKQAARQRAKRGGKS